MAIFYHRWEWRCEQCIALKWKWRGKNRTENLTIPFMQFPCECILIEFPYINIEYHYVVLFLHFKFSQNVNKILDNDFNKFRDSHKALPISMDLEISLGWNVQEILVETVLKTILNYTVHTFKAIQTLCRIEYSKMLRNRNLIKCPVLKKSNGQTMKSS